MGGFFSTVHHLLEILMSLGPDLKTFSSRPRKKSRDYLSEGQVFGIGRVVTDVLSPPRHGRDVNPHDCSPRSDGQSAEGGDGCTGQGLDVSSGERRVLLGNEPTEGGGP